MEREISIIIATYNGEKYIRKQIESIINNHDYSSLVKEVIITDDCSGDNTLSICQEYAENDERIVIVHNKKKGVVSNFVNGISISTGRYIVLSDQDDLWKDNKLIMLYSKVKSVENTNNKDAPILIYSDSEVIDENESVISNSFFKYTKANGSVPSLDKLLVKNCVQGCVMMFNRALVQHIDFNNSATWIMHDWWLMLVASRYGTIHYINEPLIQYRLHNNNVLGERKGSLLNKISRCIPLFRKFKHNRLMIFEQAKSFSEITKDKKILKTFSINFIKYENTVLRKIMAIICHYIDRI